MRYSVSIANNNQASGTARSNSDSSKATYKRIGGTPFLDMQYTVFGYVVEGLDIIDSIAAVPTDRRRGDRPMEDVVMSMKRLN